MKKLLLLLIIPLLSLGQIYECNCEENLFRITFSIDKEEKKIRKLHSLSLIYGESFNGEKKPFDDLIWTLYGVFRLSFSEESNYVMFEKWDLENHKYIVEFYDEQYEKKKYDCFWIY